MVQEFHIPSGLPACGKTTFGKEICKDYRKFIFIDWDKKVLKQNSSELNNQDNPKLNNPNSSELKNQNAPKLNNQDSSELNNQDSSELIQQLKLANNKSVFIDGLFLSKESIHSLIELGMKQGFKHFVLHIWSNTKKDILNCLQNDYNRYLAKERNQRAHLSIKQLSSYRPINIEETKKRFKGKGIHIKLINHKVYESTNKPILKDFLDNGDVIDSKNKFYLLFLNKEGNRFYGVYSLNSNFLISSSWGGKALYHSGLYSEDSSIDYNDENACLTQKEIIPDEPLNPKAVFNETFKALGLPDLDWNELIEKEILSINTGGEDYYSQQEECYWQIDNLKFSEYLENLGFF